MGGATEYLRDNSFHWSIPALTELYASHVLSCPDDGNGSNGFMLLQVPITSVFPLNLPSPVLKKTQSPHSLQHPTGICLLSASLNCGFIILLEVTKQQGSITPNKLYKTISETFVFIGLG